MRNDGRQIIFSALAICGSILVTITLIEAVLRLFPAWFPVELQQLMQANPKNYGVTHPYIGHLHKPNNALVVAGRDFSAVHHTDRYGFRNAWPWPDRAEIVVLGDSVTFGQGVGDNQAWPAILAQSFPASRVINLGLIGAGPRQYFRVYETFGLKLRSKLVLVGFFLRNDFWDEEMFEHWLKSGAGGSYMVWRDFGRPASTNLSPYQPLGSLLSSLLWKAKLLARKSYLYNLLLYVRGDLNWWSPSATVIFQSPNGTRLELQPEDLVSKTKLAQPGNYVFRRVMDALQRVHSLAKENGATVLVVLQPSKEEVYLPLVGESPPDPTAPLRAALVERGIPYLDLLEDFRRRAAEGEMLFFETDGHPNARGYALIAELVISHLKQHAKKYGL
jgi:hypothetical protein